MKVALCGYVGFMNDGWFRDLEDVSCESASETPVQLCKANGLE